MQSAGAQAELFFWLTVEGYRVTAQQQLEAMQGWQKDGKKQPSATKALLKSAALGVYEQYLSDKVGAFHHHTGSLELSFLMAVQQICLVMQQASPRVQVDQESVVNLGEKLQKDDPTPEIFDEIQRNVCFRLPAGRFMNANRPTKRRFSLNDLPTLPPYLHVVLQVYDLMLHDERYYPSFKQSPLYVRMLAELDMLKEPSYRGSDDGEGESFNGSPTGSISLVSRLHPPVRLRIPLSVC